MRPPQEAILAAVKTNKPVVVMLIASQPYDNFVTSNFDVGWIERNEAQQKRQYVGQRL